VCGLQAAGMSDVWFTSDTHFSHRAMVLNRWRPQFSTVDEMNDCMITRWNETVKPTDTVWHLGDWAMGNFYEAMLLRAKLHGNHDRAHPGYRDSYRWQREYFQAGFASVQPFARRRVNGQEVLLSHFPYTGDRHDEDRFEQFRLQDKGLWLIHGHVHEVWKIRDRQINVGVDQWDFKPVSLETIADILRENTAAPGLAAL
jgi:calcineurin-like phosphoesterase family protein